MLLKDEMREVSVNIYYFIKIEIIKKYFEIFKAFQDALNSKNFYENLKEKLLLKQKEEKLDLQKYLAGKTTLKSVFQSGTKEERIKAAEAEISEVKTYKN